MSEPSDSRSVTTLFARILASQKFHSFMVGINALKEVRGGVILGSALVSDGNSTFN